MPPSRLQASLIMAIPHKLIGILASTVATRPVDLPFLAADLAIGSFLPASLEFHFGFQKLRQEGLNRFQGRGFGLPLHGFDDFFAFFPLEMADGNCSTHRC
jgi:hypothetical protein